ncbi:hypothetical protein Nepgr_018960 [Nepenthes gracilis]|uniref:Uncharacterized protein n=1 Tax=Nepenthes gracilis TaxID=150966 RepID=A0AAD3SUW3_NEPGR|nr:hypothetical protein Nepgr_018960 [Nepenthes gracilis]
MELALGIGTGHRSWWGRECYRDSSLVGAALHKNRQWPVTNIGMDQGDSRRTSSAHSHDQGAGVAVPPNEMPIGNYPGTSEGG